MQSSVRSTVLLILAVAPACGGSGSKSASRPRAPRPAAEVRFPTASSWTDQDRVRVHGVGQGDIRAVHAGGVAATTADGFATWSAVVPLRPGENHIAVEMVAGPDGVRAGVGAVLVERQAHAIGAPGHLAWDAPRGRACLHSGDRILTLTPAGERGELARSPAAIGGAVDLEHDAGTDRLYVLRPDPGILTAVDPGTGALATVSSPAHGAGPSLAGARGLTVDSTRARAVVLAGELIVVDLRTGDRVAVPGAPGPALAGGDVAFDAATGRAIAFGADGGIAVMAVDLTTGAKDVLSGPQRGTGPGLREPARSAMDPVGSRLLVADAGVLIAVDLATGDREPLALDVGSATFAVDAFAGRGYFADPARGRVVERDLAPAGAARQVASDSFGAGAPFGSLRDVLYDTGTGHLLALQADPPALVGVDRGTGDRVVVAGAAAGTGPELEDPVDLAFDVDDERAYVADRAQGGRLLAVDPTTGDRELIAGDTRGSGPSLAGIIGSVCWPYSGVAHVLTDRGLLALGPYTGNRIAVPLTGGPPLDFASARSIASYDFERVPGVMPQLVVRLWLGFAERGPAPGAIVEVQQDRHRLLYDGVREPTAIAVQGGIARLLVADPAAQTVAALGPSPSPGGGIGPAWSTPLGIARLGRDDGAVAADAGRHALVLFHAPSGDRVVLSR